MPYLFGAQAPPPSKQVWGFMLIVVLTVMLKHFIQLAWRMGAIHPKATALLALMVAVLVSGLWFVYNVNYWTYRKGLE